MAYENLIILGIVILAGIIIAIIFVIRYIIQKLSKRDSNLSILKKRLAKGEITKQQYDELKKEFE